MHQASSATSTGKSLIDKDSAHQKNTLKKLVRDLEKDEANAYPFLEPVNWEGKLFEPFDNYFCSDWTNGLPISDKEAYGFINC